MAGAVAVEGTVGGARLGTDVAVGMPGAGCGLAGAGIAGAGIAGDCMVGEGETSEGKVGCVGRVAGLVDGGAAVGMAVNAGGVDDCPSDGIEDVEGNVGIGIGMAEAAVGGISDGTDVVVAGVVAVVLDAGDVDGMEVDGLEVDGLVDGRLPGPAFSGLGRAV